MTKFTRTVDVTKVTATMHYKVSGTEMELPLGTVTMNGQLAPKRAANAVKKVEEIKATIEDTLSNAGVSVYSVTAVCEYESSKYSMDLDTFLKYATKEDNE